MKGVLFKQSCGIGDIFFLQKIAKEWIVKNPGKEVIWPLHDNLLYLKEYIQVPNITYVPISDSHHYPSSDYTHIDFSSADQHFPGSVMLAKYRYVGVDDYWDWSRYFTYRRNWDREVGLFERIGLDKEKGSSYTLINPYCGTPPNHRYSEHFKSLKLDPTKKVVEIKPEYFQTTHIFDWYQILYFASEIHTVDTSFMYLIETMSPMTTKLHVYS